MTPDRTPLDQIALPALLRGARNTYASAIHQAHLASGFDDIPKNGAFVLGAIRRNGSPMSEIISWLHISKQAAGQLVDTLVLRGYLDRTIDPDDRRRMQVALTERGQSAADAGRAAVLRIDAVLEARVGPTAIAQARKVLAFLVDFEPTGNSE